MDAVGIGEIHVKSNKKCFFFISIVSLLFFAIGITTAYVIPDIEWDTQIPIPDSEFRNCYSLLEVEDGFISLSCRVYDQTLLTKMDFNGNIIWQKTFSGLEGASIIQTEDGGYLISGRKHVKHTYYTRLDAALCKIDASGNKIWEKTFGYECTDWGNSALETENSYILFGTVDTTGNRNWPYQDYDLYIIQVDKNGNLLNERHYGGQGPQRTFDYFNQGSNPVAVQLSNNDIIFTGVGYTIKLNDQLDLVWEKTNLQGYFIQNGYDQYYTLSGHTNKLIEIDENGNIFQEISYPLYPYYSTCSFSITSDSCYLISGSTHEGDIDPRPNYSCGDEDAFFAKMDRNGYFLWTLILTDPHYSAGGYSLIELETGGYLGSYGWGSGCFAPGVPDYPGVIKIEDPVANPYSPIKIWGTHGSGNGQFDAPQGIATDTFYYVYVTDARNNRVQKFTSNGIYVSQWGTAGTGPGQFRWPEGIAVDSTDNIYVVDKNNHRIQKFTNAGVFIRQWGMRGDGDGQFEYPEGIDIDSSNRVFVMDTGNDRIQVFDSEGNFLLKVGSEGTGDYEFNDPHGIFVNGKCVYIVDSGNKRIQRYLYDGQFYFLPLTIVNGVVDNPFSINGYGNEDNEDIFITNSIGSQISRLYSGLESSGGFSGGFRNNLISVAQWGESGAGEMPLVYPLDVEFDYKKNVYVVDAGNDRIIKYSPSVITTDMNYRLKPDSYQFYNIEGNQVSWDLYRNTYTLDQMEYPNGDHKPSAESYFRNQIQDLAKKGTCFGMGASSIFLWQDNIATTKAWDLGTNPEARLPHWNCFPYFLFTPNEFAQYFHIRQMGEPAQPFRNTHKGVSSVYSALKECGIEENDLKNIVIDFWWNTDEGHTVVPLYAQEFNDGKSAMIYIYDPNSPGIEKRIIFSLPDNMAFDPDYSSKNLDISYMPQEVFTANPRIMKGIVSLGEDVIGDISHLLITSSQGQHLGYFNGEFVEEIPGAFKLRFTGLGDKTPESYFIGDMNIDAEVIGTRYGVIKISFLCDTIDGEIDIQVKNGSRDHILISDDSKGFQIYPGHNVSNVGFILNSEGSLFSRNSQVTGYDLETGNVLEYKFSSDSDNIELLNSGKEQKLHLNLSQTGSYPGSFGYPVTIGIEDNCLLNITPDNWNDLSYTHLIANHDIGNDGNIDYYEKILVPTTSMTLYKGWNCVSFPSVLHNEKNNLTIFADVDTADNPIYFFNGEEKIWIQITKDTILQPLEAYWIYSGDNVRFPLYYQKYSFLEPLQKHLYPGWNTIGSGSRMPQSSNIALITLKDSWIYLLQFDSSLQLYLPPVINGQEPGEMVPNQGYWIYMVEPGELIGFSSLPQGDGEYPGELN